MSMDKKTPYCQDVLFFFSHQDLKINVILIKSPESYFVDVGKLLLNFIWKGKTPRIAKKILNKKGLSQRIDPTQQQFIQCDIGQRVNKR